MTTTVTPVTASELSDTQLTILSAASQRPDRTVVLPERLTGGAADKVVNALARKGLVEPVTASPSMLVWRESRDGRHLALRITDAGLKTLGIEPDAPAADEAPTEQPTPARKRKAEREPAAKAAGAKAPAPAQVRQPRAGTKQELLIAMLRGPEGATMPEMVEAKQWQAHTVRGAIAGVLKKKLGLQISSEKVEAGDACTESKAWAREATVRSCHSLRFRSRATAELETAPRDRNFCPNLDPGRAQLQGPEMAESSRSAFERTS